MALYIELRHDGQKPEQEGLLIGPVVWFKVQHEQIVLIPSEAVAVSNHGEAAAEYNYAHSAMEELKRQEWIIPYGKDWRHLYDGWQIAGNVWDFFMVREKD